MPLKTIRLSGYGPGNPRGKIIIDAEVMTNDALSRTSEGVLCWSDIRFLDQSLRQKMMSDPTCIAYYKGLKSSAGRHLFSLLTGARVNYGVPQTNDDFCTPSTPKSATIQIMEKSSGKATAPSMVFPNCSASHGTPGRYAILQSSQVDSDYGKYAGLNWRFHLKDYVGNDAFSKTYSSYLNLLAANCTLGQQDKFDIYAFCVLVSWAGGSWAGNVLTRSNYSLTFGTKLNPMPADFDMICNQVALDYARNNLPGFSQAYQISPSYGAGAFPLWP